MNSLTLNNIRIEPLFPNFYLRIGILLDIEKNNVLFLLKKRRLLKEIRREVKIQIKTGRFLLDKLQQDDNTDIKHEVLLKDVQRVIKNIKAVQSHFETINSLKSNKTKKALENLLFVFFDIETDLEDKINYVPTKANKEINEAWNSFIENNTNFKINKMNKDLFFSLAEVKQIQEGKSATKTLTKLLSE